MKTSRVYLLAGTMLLITFFAGAPGCSSAQLKYEAHSLSLSVTGTSSLHDWEMKSSKGQVDAIIKFADNAVSFSQLNFSLPAQSLKSGHKLMDKNTYKALDVDKNPNINFSLTTATVTPAGSNVYHFKGTGKLTIAGTTKSTEVSGTLKYNPADRTFTCTGIKKFKMTEYGVKPPTVMMGTIKTGDEIAISYNVTIRS